MAKETGRPEDIKTNELKEETLDEPVMDGADEVFEGNEDPRKGMSDPALVRHPEKDDHTVAPYNL